MRTVSEILENFVAVATEQRDADREFVVRCRLHDPVTGKDRKPYLIPDVLKRWNIGKAPTLKQCEKGGLSEKELRSVGLLRDPQSDGPDARSWMHFRESMVIPWYENGRVVYLTDRRLKDVDEHGNPLPKEKKARSMYAPDSNGWGGVCKPDGFNLDVLAKKPEKLHLVEGPFDVIGAWENLKWPALAFGGKEIRPGLVKRLREVMRTN